MNRHRNNSGFTLTELMVASMLISVVLTATYTLFNGSIQTWRLMEQEYNVDQRMRNVQTLFTRELESLLPAAQHLFEGNDTEITMFTVREPMNLELGQGARLLQVKYRFNPQKGQIMREEAAVTATLPAAPPPNEDLDRSKIELDDESEYLVANHVEFFRLRYVWAPLPPPREPEMPPEPVVLQYFTENRERWGYPQAVEMTITLADKEGNSHTVTSTIPLRVPPIYLNWDMLAMRFQSLEE